MNDSSQPDPPPMPSVYVPRGYIPLRNAVIRLAEMRKPKLPIQLYLTLGTDVSDPLRTGQSKADAYAWQVAIKPEFERQIAHRDWVYCFLALVDARAELREALAEDELTAQGQTTDGELMPVPASYWRTDAGGVRVSFTDRLDQYSQVFLLADRLASWLGGHQVETSRSLLKSTAGAEAKTRDWLGAKLVPSNALYTAKRNYQVEAERMFGVSRLAFNRAWRQTIEADPALQDFRKAGRKPRTKSSST